MKRYDWIKYICASAVIICTLGALVLLGPHKEPVDQRVTSYNDGFATSKQDDCEQGFQPACEWLKETAR